MRARPRRKDERQAEVHVKTAEYEGPDRREREPGSVGRRSSDRRRGGSLVDRLWLLGVTALVVFAISAIKGDEHRASRAQLATATRLERLAGESHALAVQSKRLAVQTAHNQQANTQSLCSFRRDLLHRVADTSAFLMHPEQIPAFSTPGVIAAIKVSLASQRATLASLSPPRSPLRCEHARLRRIPSVSPSPPPNLPPIVRQELRGRL